LQTAGAGFRLLTEIVLPGLESRPLPPLVDQYDRIEESLFRLGRVPVRSLVNR
jgi:hypothetical protein